MGACYRQLTEEDRIEIYALRKAKKTHAEIARQLGRHVSTIKRELKRNQGQRGYRPKQAQAKAQARHHQPRYRKMTPEVVEHIESRLAKHYSPEQISNTMEETVSVRISQERIYQHVWKDKREGGNLWRNLRIGGVKRRRKRYGKKDWRGKISGRVDIDERPAIVEERTRIGDWEADLVAGKGQSGFLVTLVERKSGYLLLGHVKRKTAELVTAEIIRLMLPIYWMILTLTFDNGREFAGHQTLAQMLNCATYFAKPYHSWERGSNENTNGLARQYFPKDRDLSCVDPVELLFVQNRLNTRPRKRLDFQTPEQILFMSS